MNETLIACPECDGAGRDNDGWCLRCDGRGVIRAAVKPISARLGVRITDYLSREGLEARRLWHEHVDTHRCLTPTTEACDEGRRLRTAYHELRERDRAAAGIPA